MTQRFFKVQPNPYEAVRRELALARGETLEPLETVRRAADGQVLLAAWSFHCEIPEIAAAILQMQDNAWGVEISETEYTQQLPPVVLNG
jgi:hypothetical protein